MLAPQCKALGTAQAIDGGPVKILAKRHTDLNLWVLGTAQ